LLTPRSLHHQISLQISLTGTVGGVSAFDGEPLRLLSQEYATLMRRLKHD